MLCTEESCNFQATYAWDANIAAAFLLSSVTNTVWWHISVFPAPTGGSGWLNSKTLVSSSMTQGGHNRLIINEWAGPRQRYICTAWKAQCNRKDIFKFFLPSAKFTIQNMDFKTTVTLQWVLKAYTCIHGFFCRMWEWLQLMWSSQIQKNKAGRGGRWWPK